MYIPLLTSALLLLTTLTTTLAHPSPNKNTNTILVSRQRQTAPQANTTCADYARLANYTAIDSNSTYRAAFLQASPQGTDPTRVILDRATVEFTSKKLMFDGVLNRQCGNLSTVALREVATNFTGGVIAGWKVVAPTGARIGAAREVWCVGFSVLMIIGFGLSI